MADDAKAQLWQVFWSLTAAQQIAIIAMAIAVVLFGFWIGKWAGGVESKAEIERLHTRLESQVRNTAGGLECKATITSPKTGDKVPQAFLVEATISGIPEGFVPWIVTTDRENPTHYWPQNPATPGDDGIWRGNVDKLGGKEGKHRSFALLLVGRDGQLLIASWKEGWVKGRDPLKQFTSDTIKCAEKDVVLTETVQ